jgi:large subunit ribosomal protein L10
VPNPAKEEKVKELNDVFQRAKSVVLANYQGIDALSITNLRVHLRSKSVEFRVIKNTLARQAAKNTPFEVIDPKLMGPISLALSFDDAVAPAKALAEYSKSNANKKSPEVICGVVDGQLITPEQVKALADLPSREVLLSQMLSVFQGPTTNFVGVFSSLLRKLVGTIDAVREKKSQE